MRVLISALLFCIPVALFANANTDVKADQNISNVVMNHDFDQVASTDIAADTNDMNLDEGASSDWRRRWWGRGWGRGWGYGGWGYGYPYYGYGYGWGWPYYGYYGWGW